MGVFVVRENENGFEFEVRTEAGETLVVSSLYKTLKNAHHGARSVLKTAPKAHFDDQTRQENCKKEMNPKFELSNDGPNAFSLCLRAKNGQVLLSKSGMPTKEEALRLIDEIRKSCAAGNYQDVL